MAEAALLQLDLLIVRASDDELAEHARVLAEIDAACGGASLWRGVTGDA
jgi:hypothetical protein